VGKRNSPQKGLGPKADEWAYYRDPFGLTTEHSEEKEGYITLGSLFTTALELLVRFPSASRRLPAHTQGRLLSILRGSEGRLPAQEELAVAYMSLRLDGGGKAREALASTPWWHFVRRAVLALASGLSLGLIHRFLLILSQALACRRARKRPEVGVSFALRNAVLLQCPWPGLRRSALAAQMRYNRAGGLAEGLLNCGDHWASHPITHTLVFKEKI